MKQPDFDRARRYALDRMKHELGPNLYYHSLAHTRDEVVPAVERLASSMGVDGAPLTLLRTAAYFHDIGYIQSREDHEETSVRIAQAALPGFGYTPGQVQAISELILVTKLPQTPRNLLEEILADGDLDVLGRDDFLIRSYDLRAELATEGQIFTDTQWYRRQLEFLQAHQFWTKAARELRKAQKQVNIATLIRLLNHR